MLAVEDIVTDNIPFAQMELINLNQILQERLETCYFPPRVEVSTHLVGELVITADRKKVGRIAGNLLNNAQKKLEELKEGRLLVATYVQDGCAVIEIGNTGAISPDVRDKIFNDQHTIAGKEGTGGQGLAIVKLFTVMHKGRVEFESSPEKNWTVFRVRLPLR